MNSDKIIQQNHEIYNVIADHFSDTRSFLWEDLECFRSYVKEGDQILDVGCGNGRLYQLFESPSMSSVQFTGIDISEKLIDLAKKTYPTCTFTAGDMRILPYDDNFFDVVFSLVAFHHLPDRESQIQSLQEMKRVVKPGGKIILLNWNAYSDWVKEKIAKGDYEDLGNQLFRVPWKRQDKTVLGDRVYYGFTLDELETLFKEVDLTLDDQYFLRHGERVGIEKGMNIVSVAKKCG